MTPMADSLLEAMADAFASVEAKNRVVHELVVGRTVLKALKASGLVDSARRTVWGASLRFDRKARGFRIVLRSRGSPALVLGRAARKTVTLTFREVL